MIKTEVKVYPQSGLGYFVSYRDPFTKRVVKKRIGDRKDAENYRDEILKKLALEISEKPGPVIEANDVLKEPQLVYREIVAHSVGPKKQTFVRQPLLFDAKNFPLERQAPDLGEHTQEILAALDKAAE